MTTLTRCDGVRVGGLGATLALHILALTVLCLPAVLPDRVPPRSSSPLQISAIVPADALPPVPLPPPPAPPARPIPAAPAVPRPPTPVAATDRSEVFEPASPAVSSDAALAANDAPAQASTSAPVERALAYAQVHEPLYPADALRRGEQGVVLLRVSVAADGSVERVEIERGSGSSRLDRAARDAVRRWRFVPPLVDGVPTAAVGTVPIAFRLPART